MNSKSQAILAQKNEKHKDETKPLKIGSTVQSQMSFLPSKVQRLAGKRSYIQMPINEKKQKKDSNNKTKTIQKLPKKNNNRKQKTQELQNYNNEYESQINYEQQVYGSTIEVPQIVMIDDLYQNTSVGEFQKGDERQKIQLDDKNTTQGYKNQQKSSNSANNLERTYSQESHISERTLTDQNAECHLGFVIDNDDDDEMLSYSIKSVPITPPILSSQQNIDNNEANIINQNLQSNNKNKLVEVKPFKESILQTLQYLYERQQYYKVSKVIFETRHPEITSKNRQILIDWLMDVSDKFKLKRQTFQIAINFADRYLMQVRNFELDNYQRLGITCLLMACKIEEIYYPKHIDFQSITDDNCSLEEILEQETKILISLKWLVNPPTLNYWGNIYMMLWDQYSDDNQLGLSILDSHQINIDNINLVIPKFKSDENKDYLNFRHVMQVLDLAFIDLEHYLYDPRHLCIASIVIIVALNFQKLTLEQITEKIELHKQQVASNYKIDLSKLDYIYDQILSQEYDEFSHMLINYIEFYCDIRVPEIKESLRYIQLFYTIPLQTQMPTKLQDHKAASQEEFYSFQVYYNNLEQSMDRVYSLKKELQL